MLKSHFLTSVTAIFLACSLRAQAQSETIPASDTSNDGIIIEGDKLELHLDRKMRSIGNASMHRGKQDMYGDVIEYDVQNDELQITGNARIEVGNASLTGPELHMRLSEGLGEMRDASIKISKSSQPHLQQRHAVSSETFAKRLGDLQSEKSGSEDTLLATETILQGNEPQDSLTPGSTPLSTTSPSTKSRGDAKTIFFEGQDKKRLLDARYTTCAVGVDDWYIKAKELRLNDFTESGVAKNGYIEFKGVPILYSPWISFSYNNQRKSGLLAPSYGTTTTGGFELTIPYYWNISPNMDATITAREMSKRGVQLQGEFRYLEENFSGVDHLEYLPSDNQRGNTRYYANLKHQQTLGNGWSAGYSLERVSDNQYFSELSTRMTTTSRIILPQQFNIDYADNTWRFNAIAQKFQTLDNASYPYERLPQMTLSGNKYFGNANANLYTQLVAFDTNATNKNASLLTTGTRATAYPSVSLPMNRSYGYITPKFGVHLTNYSLNNDPNNFGSQQRALPIFSLDSGLFFDRDFKIASRGYSQTLEPRLFYVYIPNKDQSKIPVFDTGLLDLNFSSLFAENQFTGNDRINDANQVSLALTTRLIESDTGTQRLSASLGQRYYFADQKVALPGATLRKSNSSDIIAGLTANLRTSWNVNAFWQYNTDTASLVRSTLSARYNPEPGKALNLSYSNRRDLTVAALGTDIDQFNVSGQWPLSRGWYGVGRVNYSLREKQIIETIAGVEYNAGCWQTRSVIQRISTATANANYALFFQLELGGLASVGTSPLSIIKRSIPGYVRTGLIPETDQQSYYE